ncbi:phage tail length tape-measure protein [Geomicrobium sp. JCM 19055]|nr:phage tail length tape-measure protein [Geomicrobium sp. JCM 19055]
MLNLATLASMDLGRTADITSNVLSAMGMEADETGRLVDVMAQAISSSNVTGETLGQTFSYVAPTANNLGIEIEELTATIGLLGSQGLQSGRAGRGLRAALDNLANASGDAKDQLDALNVQVFDSEGEFRNFNDIIRDLDNALEGMSADERGSVLSDIFDTTGADAMNMILAEGSEKLDEFTAEMENAEGQGANLAEVMADNLYGSLNSLTSSLHEIGIQIFEILEPSLSAVIQVAEDLVNWFGDLDESTMQFLVVLGGLAIVIPVIITGFGLIIGAVAGFIAILKLTLSPLGLLLAGVIGIGSALTIAWTQSETFRDVVTTAFTSVMETGREIFNSLREIFEDFMTRFMELWDVYGDPIMDAMNEAFDRIREVGSQAFEGIGEFFRNCVEIIQEWWDQYGDAVMDRMEEAFQSVQDVAEVVFPIIAELFEIAWREMEKVLGWLERGFGDMMDVVGKIIEGDWAGAMNILLDLAIDAFKAVWNGTGEWLDEKVLGFFREMGGNASDALSDLVDSITEPFRKGYENAVSFVDDIKDAISNMFNTHITMPRFSYTGSLNPVNWPSQGLPSLSVDWYETGGIFTGASVIGVGENGDEAVLPLSNKSRMKPFAEAVSSMMGDGNSNDGDGKTINVNFNEAIHIREEADIKKLTEEMKKRERIEERAKGVFAYN